MRGPGWWRHIPQGTPFHNGRGEEETEVIQNQSSRPRFALIDIARGAAIIAMAIYHLCWDLWYFGFIATGVGYEPGWVLFARAILWSFLFLVGTGLVLGHGRGIRWSAFWRRWIFVAIGALLITLATWLGFPETFVYFGVLHAIALFSLAGLAFVRAPLALVAAIALVVIAAPFFYSDPLFNQKWWSWIGFWQVPPPTNDLVPVFPSFGAVLLGILAMRLVLASPLAPRLAAIEARSRAARALAWLGRWSLLIYLLHQPLLLGLIYPAAQVMQPQIGRRTSDFLQSCQSTCEGGGTSAALCTTYCQCGLEGIEKNELWDAVYSGLVSAEQQALLDAQNRQCSAVIYPEPGVQ